MVKSTQFISAALILMILLALPGCFVSPQEESGPSGAVSDSDNTTSAPVNLEFRDCIAQELDLAVSQNDISDNIPEGFEPTRPGSFSETDPTGTTAYLMLVTEACLDEEGEEVVVFFAWIPVIPPDEYRDPDAVLHVLQLGFASDRGKIVETLSKWNVTSISAEFTITHTLLPTHEHMSINMEENGREILMVTSISESFSIPAPEEKVRAFVTASGVLLNGYDMQLAPHMHRLGLSSIIAPAGSTLFPDPTFGGEGSDIPLFGGFNLTYVPLMKLVHVDGPFEENAQEGLYCCPRLDNNLVQPTAFGGG